jgi:hypothetical protein
MFSQSDKSLAYGVLISNVQETPNGKLEDYAESPEIIKIELERQLNWLERRILYSNLIVDLGII